MIKKSVEDTKIMFCQVCDSYVTIFSGKCVYGHSLKVVKPYRNPLFWRWRWCAWCHTWPVREPYTSWGEMFCSRECVIDCYGEVLK